MKSTHTGDQREPVVMAGAVTIAPVRATAEVASQRGARIQGPLFREVLRPRCAPLAPPPPVTPSRAVDTVALVIVCGIASLFLARLLEVFA